MRITQFSFMPIRQKVKSASLQLKFGKLMTIDSVLIRITSESGEHGYGIIEALPPLSFPSEVVIAILKHYGETLIGGDARNPLAVIRLFDDALFDLNYSFSPVRAGIDCALHDLAARIENVPLSIFLGGKSGGSIPVLELLPLNDPDHMDASIEAALKNGARALKVKMDGNLLTDIERVSKVRQIAGPDIAILCDANGSYSCDEALLAAEKLYENNVSVFEQPVPGKNLDDLARITKSTPIDIEADESVRSILEAENVVMRRGANCISLRIARFGGIIETMNVARLCVENGLLFRFGAMFLPSLYDAIAMQVAIALPPSPHPHELAMHRLFQDDPFDGLELQEGMLSVDGNAPGIGLTLKPEHDNFVQINV